MKAYLIIGRILGAHGVNGDIKVYPLTDDVNRFDQLASGLLLGRDETFIDTLQLSDPRYKKGCVLLHAESIIDRDQAQALKGMYVAVWRRHAAPLTEGRYYIVDLIGCQMKQKDRLIGQVIDVLQTGAHDIFVVKRKNLPDLLVPYILSVVVDVQIEAKQIYVHLPDGLEEVYAPDKMT